MLNYFGVESHDQPTDVTVSADDFYGPTKCIFITEMHEELRHASLS